MKKTFAVLFLISFLAVLAVPLVTSAQVADCCVIKRTFNFEDFNAKKGWCVAPILQSCTTTAGVIGMCYYESAYGRSTTTSWGMVCILNTIYRVSDLAFAILIALSILLILLAAYTFLTAGGAPEKVNKARDYILYALVGLVVAFLARAIPSLVALVV